MAQIVISGQATGSTGGIATGIDTIPLVTINGCVFANIAACPNIPTILPGEVNLTRDRVQDTLAPQSDGSLDLALVVAIIQTDGIGRINDELLTVPSVQIHVISRFNYEPLIDEPVTGSGNDDDLWMHDCDSAKQGSCSPSA